MSSVRNSAVMPVLLVWLISLQIIFSCCADKVKTSIIDYKALDEGLTNSNKIIGDQSQRQLTSLENKMSDPATSDKAKIWYPKAQQIEKLSKDMYNYIEELRAELKKEAGLKEKNGTESIKESDKNAVMRVFNKRHKGKELYQKLKQFQSDILKTDPGIESSFKDNLLVTTATIDANKDKESDFTETFFDDIPAVAALAMLSKFQNNVVIIENRITSFCQNKVTGTVSQ